MKLIKRNDGLLPSMWDSFYHDDWFTLPNTPKSNTTTPAINIMENENDFIIELAVPGMKKDDFNIDIEKNLLTISAEKRTENENKDTTYTRKEFGYLAFERSFTLPETVDGDKINAKYTDGVLGITIPKKEEAKPKPPKKIQIA